MVVAVVVEGCTTFGSLTVGVVVGWVTVGVVVVGWATVVVVLGRVLVVVGETVGLLGWLGGNMNEVEGAGAGAGVGAG